MPVKNSINNQSTGFTVNAPTSGTALTVTAVAGSLAATFAGSNVGGISVSQATGGAGSFQAVQSSVDPQPVYFNIFKNRAGGDISGGDVLAQYQAFGYRGTNQVAGIMRCYAESVGATRVSGAWDWFTTSTAGVSSQRLFIGSDGNIVINAPSVTSQALTVNGFAGTANYAFVSTASVSAGLYQSSRFINTSTTAGSGCRVDVSVNQQPITTGGETFIRYANEGIQAISTGLNTATQQYVMSSGSTLAIPNSFFTYTVANNQINLPLQSCFHAYVNATIANVTGNGTNYQIVFNTETFDQGSNYNNATGLFTAPATGRYAFTYSLYLTGLVNHGQYFTQLVTTSLTYTLSDIQPNANILTFATNLSVTNPTIFVAMTAGDTAFVRINVNGGTNTQVVDIFGAINDPRSNFSGYLIC